MKLQNLNLSSFAIIILFITSFAYSSEINIVKGKAVIIDGDTIKINDQIIRFGGIDAPESFYRGKKQECYLNEKKIQGNPLELCNNILFFMIIEFTSCCINRIS